MTKTRPIAERLWAKVSQRPTTRGCLLWQGYKNRKGYGRISVRRGVTPISVHRLAWELAHGPIPDGLHVLHDCDVRNCVNIEHLFLGTIVDNNKDRHKKGRYATGSKHHNAKLTDKKVLKMKQLRTLGWTYQRIADFFHVAKITAQNAINGENWAHLIR